MTILDGDQDYLSRLWNLVAELSEELSRNRALAVQLYTQANDLKNQAIHSETGFVLRRFNLDKPKDVYESELERMNAAMSAENRGLHHDNKQIGALIKDYEQTLETLMSAFRTKARDVQEHELSLVREYEEKLLGREEATGTQELANSLAISQSLARLSNSMRSYARAFGGEEKELSSEANGAAAEWALSREIELARLEKENEMLRRMLEIPVPPRKDDPDVHALEPSRGLSGGNSGQGQVLGVSASPLAKRPRPAG